MITKSTFALVAVGVTIAGTLGSGVAVAGGIVQGPAGPAGAVGAAGRDGANGAVGASGPAGAVGKTGATGAAGPQGPEGATGATGAHGLTGAAGADGVAGAVGARGAQGPQGAPGLQGAQGLQGAPGLQGAQGAQGVAGPQGVPGPVGPVGPAGPNDGWTVLAQKSTTAAITEPEWSSVPTTTNIFTVTFDAPHDGFVDLLGLGAASADSYSICPGGWDQLTWTLDGTRLEQATNTYITNVVHGALHSDTWITAGHHSVDIAYTNSPCYMMGLPGGTTPPTGTTTISALHVLVSEAPAE